MLKSESAGVLAASDACLAILKNISMFKTTYLNKVFDYMASGRPTILAIDGVIRKVVRGAKGGIFVPTGNPQALAQAVRELSRDYNMARCMGEQARAYVAKNFNRQKHAQVFFELLKNIGSSNDQSGHFVRADSYRS